MEDDTPVDYPAAKYKTREDTYKAGYSDVYPPPVAKYRVNGNTYLPRSPGRGISDERACETLRRMKTLWDADLLESGEARNALGLSVENCRTVVKVMEVQTVGDLVESYRITRDQRGGVAMLDTKLAKNFIGRNTINALLGCLETLASTEERRKEALLRIRQGGAVRVYQTVTGMTTQLARLDDVRDMRHSWDATDTETILISAAQQARDEGNPGGQIEDAGTHGRKESTKARVSVQGAPPRRQGPGPTRAESRWLGGDGKARRREDTPFSEPRIITPEPFYFLFGSEVALEAAFEQARASAMSGDMVSARHGWGQIRRAQKVLAAMREGHKLYKGLYAMCDLHFDKVTANARFADFNGAERAAQRGVNDAKQDASQFVRALDEWHGVYSLGRERERDVLMDHIVETEKNTLRASELVREHLVQPARLSGDMLWLIEWTLRHLVAADTQAAETYTVATQHALGNEYLEYRHMIEAILDGRPQ